MRSIKNSFLLGFMLITAFTFGQVRIVNAPNNAGAVDSSAFIDASSNPTMNLDSNIGKGLLFPRTDLTEFTFSGGPYGRPNTYPTYYDGFIVYNTATSGVAKEGATQGGALFEGFWYYENKSTTSVTEGIWIPIGAGADVKAGLEPWFGTDDKMGATSNTEDIYQMGSVGIGTDAPTQKLEVEGNAVIGPNADKAMIGGANGWAGISHRDQGVIGGYALLQNPAGRTSINAATGQNISFSINNQLQAMLTSAGNFGINVNSTASQKLDVGGRARIRTLDAGLATDEVVVADANGVLKKVPASSFGGDEPWFGDDDDAAATTNTEDIYHMGSIGVKVNDPQYALDVNGSFQNTGHGLFSVMNGSDDMTINKRGIYMWDDTNNAWGIYMSRSGLGRSLTGDPAIAATGGSAFNDYAIRFRVEDHANRGFIFENSNEELLMSIRGDGFVHFEDRVRVNNLPLGAATDSVVVADATGLLKKVPRSSVGGADGDAWGVNGEDKTSGIFRGGNVGIGLTAAPTQKLEVNGNAQIGTPGREMQIGNMGYTNHAGIAHKDRASAGNYALIQSNLGSTMLNASTGQDIHFRINNVDGAVLNAQRNFGIGTNMPTVKLDVNGKTRIRDTPETADTGMGVLVADANGNVKKRTNVPFVRHHFNQNFSGTYDYPIINGTVHLAFGADPVRFGMTFMVSGGRMFTTGTYGGVTITGQGGNNMTVTGASASVNFVYDSATKTLKADPTNTWYYIVITGHRN